MLGVPAIVLADTAAAAKAKAVTSPFKADRLSSKPSGLTPDGVTSPVRYPEQAVILTWGDVPDAAGYTVEVSDNPGFSRTIWTADTTQAIAVPEVLLPDGSYWWRVRAVDAAGTHGIWSDVARVAKTWPNQISGTRVSATPTGAAASFTALNPYLFWNPVPGAKSYDVQVSPGNQFNNVVFTGINIPEPFATPGAVGALPDDTYNWRVRAHDPNDNLGPWTVASSFTKEWTRPNQLSPANGVTTGNLLFAWEPIDGAQKYQIQITDMQFNYIGTHLKVDTTTAASAFVPTLAEQLASPMVYGDIWWRVRPIIDGVYGKWTAAPDRRVDWQHPGAGTVPVLSSSGDSDTGLSPVLSWTPVTGANIYRVDIATDPGFTNVLESQMTSSTSWASRVPLPDNQVGSGYYWRVVWGAGTLVDDPQWMVDEDLVDSAQFAKQTRVTLGTPASGGVIGESPLLNWGSVPGIAKYAVELSPDGLFQTATTRKATIFGLGAVPGSMASEEKRLPEGTWSWRVRAVDGGDAGQSWSPVGQFTLASPRPAQRAPNDGATVVYSPLVQWSPVSGACSYDVQVGRDPSFGATADASILNTAQTAVVPPNTKITTPGLHYWRVRADYCGDVKGQWSPTRNFRSVFPPDFNLNSIPSRVKYRTRVLVAGKLKNNGSGVRKARVYLERRLYPSDRFRPAGSIRTGPGGRFRFALRMSRSADYRLVWRESATNPEGTAAFGIDVTPRVTFRLASSRVVRRKGLRVKGSIYPRRPAVIQMRTSDGWQTLRKLKPRRNRFSVVVPTSRIDPGKHRIRLRVPRDSKRRFANTASRQRRVLVYDRFVIR